MTTATIYTIHLLTSISDTYSFIYHLVVSGEDVLILLIHSLLVHLLLVHPYEAQEVGGAVRLVVELLGVARDQPVLDTTQHPHTHEVVVPDLVVRNHEEPKEVACQDQLCFLVERGIV